MGWGEVLFIKYRDVEITGNLKKSIFGENFDQKYYTNYNEALFNEKSN